MTMLIAAAAFFLAIHFFVSGTRLRDVIVGAIGERPYLGVFSLVSVAAIIWLVMSYNAAFAAGGEVWWDLGAGVRHLGIIVIAIAFLFVVSGILTSNPAALGEEGSVAKENVATGILRITRHPFLWGTALWAAFHVAANGDAPSVIFFGTFLVLAVVGTYLIDAKRARKMGAAWEGFAAKTSNLPFAAIVAGRNTLKLGEVLTWRQAAALGVFLVFLFVHAWLFGASPFPGGWVPF
jgi:uncharacterized membrane protein